MDQKSKRLYFKVATGDKKDDVKQFEVELGQGIAGHVAKTGEPLLIPDVAKDPRWYKEISESIGFKTQSIACVPMKTVSTPAALGAGDTPTRTTSRPDV